MVVQWVHLGSEVVIASGDGAWIGMEDVGSSLFADPMPDTAPGELESTRHLLDGAIGAGERVRAVPPPPAMTPLRWAWFLAAQWYSARHSIALMSAAIARFQRDGREDLAAHARRKLDDERGHDELPIADLGALGYDGRALVEAVAPDPGVVAGIDYARSTLQGPHPTEFLGYMFALERRMSRVPERFLEELERNLPPGATAGLRAHATELDVEHVEQAVAFFSTLPADDRTSIAIGCYRISQIRAAWLTGPQPSEEELDAWLSPYEISTSRRSDHRQTQRTGEPA